MQRPKPSRLKISGVIPLVGLVVFITVAINIQPFVDKQHAKVATKEQQYHLPPSPWLNVFSLGYNEAAADVIWAQFIIYFSSVPKQTVQKGMLLGEKISKKAAQINTENYTLNYVHAVTRLDPKFLAAYAHGARLTMYHKGIITSQTVQMAIDILEEGIKHFPDNGELFFNLGFLYYYEMTPFVKNEADKIAWKEKGTLFLSKAVRLPGAPPYAAGLASSLLTRAGMTKLAVEHLTFLLLAETDPAIRAHIEKQLDELVGEEMMFQRQQMKMFTKNWEKKYSFIPFDLYTLLYTPHGDTKSLYDTAHKPPYAIHTQ